MPRVSLIVPCYNEQKRILALLEALLLQDFPLTDLEVIVADGMSGDATRQIIQGFAEKHTELSLRIVDNPRRNIPAALNVAIQAARGDVVVRLDAHSAPDRNYLKLCLEDLTLQEADNVGGIWLIQPGSERWISKAIALAAAHPFGVGDARYRYASQPGYVDTVPFGAFRRETFTRFGLFDESLLTNEDYEYNTRLRQHGGKIWLDPRIRSRYYARPDLSSLAKQYWRYGFWKLQMLRRYPTTIRWRQALPPAFVLLVGLLLALAPIHFYFLFALIGTIGLYLLILAAGSLPPAIKNADLRLTAGIPIAMATMHFSWGSGFLWSLIKTFFKG